MRLAVCFWLCVPLLAGCGGTKKTDPKPAPKSTKLIVTPADTSSGTVVEMNEAGRFVVIKYPLGALPPPGQKWSVYRRGLKVGEVRITGPEQDDKTVADIIAGEAKPGDGIQSK